MLGMESVARHYCLVASTRDWEVGSSNTTSEHDLVCDCKSEFKKCPKGAMTPLVANLVLIHSNSSGYPALSTSPAMP